MKVSPPKPVVGWGMAIGTAFALLATAVLMTVMLPEQQGAFWLLILLLGLGLAGMSFLTWVFEALEEIAVEHLELNRRRKK